MGYLVLWALEEFGGEERRRGMKYPRTGEVFTKKGYSPLSHTMQPFLFLFPAVTSFRTRIPKPRKEQRSRNPFLGAGKIIVPRRN